MVSVVSFGAVLLYSIRALVGWIRTNSIQTPGQIRDTIVMHPMPRGT